MNKKELDELNAMKSLIKELAKGEEPEEFYNYITTPVATQENVVVKSMFFSVDTINIDMM